MIAHFKAKINIKALLDLRYKLAHMSKIWYNNSVVFQFDHSRDTTFNEITRNSFIIEDVIKSFSMNGKTLTIAEFYGCFCYL
jgi:hypothetical protein